MVTFLTPLASLLLLRSSKGSLGLAFTVPNLTEIWNQMNFYPWCSTRDSVLVEINLGTSAYHITDVPPRPNSRTEFFFHLAYIYTQHFGQENGSIQDPQLYYGISTITLAVVVLQKRGFILSHLYYIYQIITQIQPRVKLNRVFFPRCCYQDRSLGCCFAG